MRSGCGRDRPRKGKAFNPLACTRFPNAKIILITQLISHKKSNALPIHQASPPPGTEEA